MKVSRSVRRTLVVACCVVAALLARASTLTAESPLSQRIGHTDPARYRPLTAVHEGAGTMGFMTLLPGGVLGQANLNFIHRGVIDPKSGIGHHFHNQVEEMYVILDGEAQFTVDGRTSVLEGPVAVVCRIGSAHAVYNATDSPLEWMNINVGNLPGFYDAFNLGDTRVGAALDPVPTFMSMKFDRALLRPLAGAKGEVGFRRGFGPAVFATPWAYVDHVLLQPGASTPAHSHEDVAEAYYVMAGRGTVTVTAEGGASSTESIQKGDAIPILLGETSLFSDTGSEPLELLVTGVARSMETKNAFMLASRSRR